MIFRKKVIEEIKITYLVIKVPVLPNPKLVGLPKLDSNGIFEIMVDIETGRIIGWPESEKEWLVSSFVQKCGSYQLLDSNQRKITEIKEGEYGVPNNIVPPKEGLSDYVTLKINKEGVITNWLSEPSLIDFEDIQKV